MAKYYVKGTMLTTLEESVKSFKGKEKKAIFVTIKNPIFCDKNGNELAAKDVEAICTAVSEELKAFTPAWAKNNGLDADGQPIVYLNLASQYQPKLYILQDGKPVEVGKDSLRVNNAEVICYCNNTYHNQILILKEGEPSVGAFDEGFNA